MCANYTVTRRILYTAYNSLLICTKCPVTVKIIFPFLIIKNYISYFFFIQISLFILYFIIKRKMFSTLLLSFISFLQQNSFYIQKPPDTNNQALKIFVIYLLLCLNFLYSISIYFLLNTYLNTNILILITIYEICVCGNIEENK